MRYALLAVMVVGLMPVVAEAGHRDRDRDSRWSVSVGFGYSDYGYRSGSHFGTGFSYSEGYRYRGHYPRYDYYPRPVYREYCPPPVVYRPAPVYAPPPVVYYPPPVYRYEPCYPSGGYTYYRARYHYGR
jgi:hypothetical protein